MVAPRLPVSRGAVRQRASMRSSTRNLVIGGLVLAALVTVFALFSSVTMYLTGAPPQPSPSPTSVELVDQSLRELNWGNIVFNVSETMRYEQPQAVELLLSPSLSVADLQAQLQQKAGAESAQVRISNRMEAQLTGRGFAIEALTPDLQAVTSQQATRWKWEVTPTEHGQQTLHLALSARLDVAGRDTPLVVRTFDREILVNITIPQRVSSFLEKNWQWLWAAVAVPIAGYLWKRRRKRRPRSKRGAA